MRGLIENVRKSGLGRNFSRRVDPLVSGVMTSPTENDTSGSGPRTDDSPSHESLTDELRAAADLLARVAADRTLLMQVPNADARRLLDLVAQVFNPDAKARRAMVKATAR